MVRTWTATQDEQTARTTAAPINWRQFLRGLALELDAQAGPELSRAILRGAGHQMATMLGLLAVDSLEALELEMNAALAEVGWGSVRLALQEAERCVVLEHTGLPRVGSAGEPPGFWLGPVLEGLYEGWMAQQPGADTSLHARIVRYDPEAVVLRYERHGGLPRTP